MKFLSFEHLEAIVGVINWPNFNIVVSQGTGRSKEMERWGNGRLVEQSEHTQHLSIKFAVLYGRGLWRHKTIAIVISMIIDRHNRYNNNEKV
jgi:hypothetical protein